MNRRYILTFVVLLTCAIYLSGCASMHGRSEMTDPSPVRVSASQDALASESVDRSQSRRDQSLDFQQAAVLCSQGRFEQGLRRAREKASADGHSPESWTTIGNCYLRQGNERLAELHYHKALELNPNFIPAQNNLAVVHYQQGDQAAAFSLLKEITQKNRALSVPSWNMAKLYLNSYLFDQSEAHIRTLMARSDSDPELLIGLAMIMQVRGNRGEAKRLYQRARVENSSHSSFLTNYAILLYDERDYEGAERVARRALRLLQSSQDQDRSHRTVIEGIIQDSQAARQSSS